jgi:hypothetical protein
MTTTAPSNYMSKKPNGAGERSTKQAAYLYENCERRHTCLQQARYATDGLHDRDLRVGERFGPRFVSAHERDVDYAEPGKGGSRFWAWWS